MGAITVSKREPKRSRVFLSARVEAAGSASDARIRDISTTGALLESDFEPGAGTEVQLSCGESRMSGRVAWAERGWFGVEFDTPLLTNSLVDPLGAQLMVSAPRTYRSADALD